MSFLTNLISYWKLDEASGNALDAQGTNDLTDHNSVGTATGKISNARQFATASTRYFSHADNADLSLGSDQAFTFNAWVQLASIPNTMVVVGKDDGGSNREYVLYWQSGVALRFIVLDGSGSAAVVSNVTPGATISTNTWYMVTAWHDPNSDEVGIALNAGTPDTISWTTGTRDQASDFQIGAGIGNGAFTWDGLIDEVGFWKRTLTSQDRTDLYNGGAGLAYSSFGGGANNYTLTSSAGSYTLAGQDAALKSTRTLTASAGAYTLTGQAATLSKGRTLTAAAGAYTLTGNASNLLAGRILTSATGTYALTGQAASLKQGRTFTAAAGAYTLTGVSAGPTVGHKITAGTGSYTLTGQAASLTYIPVGSYVLPCAPGPFALTGRSADLPTTRLLPVAPGSYTLLGQPATPARGLRLTGLGSNFALAGQPAGSLTGRRLTAAGGTLTLTGRAAAMTWSGLLVPVAPTAEALLDFDHLRAATLDF